MITIIIIVTIIFIILLGVSVFLYKRYKQKESKPNKTEYKIALPTLGTQYKISSVLSINSMGRKLSGFSQASDLDEEEKIVLSDDVTDGPCDSCSREMTRAEEYIASIAETQNSLKEDKGCILTNHHRALNMNGESLFGHNERLATTNVGEIQALNSTKKMLSEVTMSNCTNPTSLSKSNSDLVSAPPIPPKCKPLLPPKQTINKSKEDMERINQEILRISSQPGVHNSKSEANLTLDMDYDFPANSNCDEEYDEPCSVVPYKDDDLSKK